MQMVQVLLSPKPLCFFVLCLFFFLKSYFPPWFVSLYSYCQLITLFGLGVRVRVRVRFLRTYF